MYYTKGCQITRHNLGELSNTQKIGISHIFLVNRTARCHSPPNLLWVDVADDDDNIAPPPDLPTRW